MPGKRILVVDDNAQSLKLMRVLLAGAGYDVDTAMNPDEAVKAVARFKPELILMDIQLPGGMDGLELTRHIKSDPRWRKIAVFALTAYAMKGDRERALAAGCDGYIAKPIDADVLTQIITAHFRDAR